MKRNSSFKIEIIGKVYDNHSLAIINRNLALELDKYADVYLTPLDQFDYESKVDKKVLAKLDELKNKEAVEDPDIQIRHTYPPIWRWPLSDKTKIVYIQPWEYYKVPFEWQTKWEYFADAVICPSSWNEIRYLEAGLNPNKLYMVPNGYNPEVFNTKDKTSSDKLTFTYVGCAQHRKGADVMLNAWSEALVRADRVKLYIKDTPSIYGENNLLHEIIKMQYKSDCAEIIYIDDKLSEQEMADLYKETDILVHPFRGEGFGMHIQEAMACGAMPLISRGGAPEQFVNDDNGIFIEVSQQVVDITDPNLVAGKPGDAFTNMGQHTIMNEPSKEDLVNKIRGLYHSHTREEILSRVDNAALYTWENIGQQYMDVFNELMTGNKVQRIK